MEDVWSQLFNSPIRRRSFLQITGAATAGAAADPAAILAAMNTAAMKAAIDPLKSLLEIASGADTAIDKTIPRRVRHLFSEYNTTDSPEKAIGALTQLATTARQLLMRHPAMQQLVDSFFAVDPNFDIDLLTQVADFVLASPKNFDSKTQGAAFQIQKRGAALSDAELDRLRPLLEQAFKQSDKSTAAFLGLRDKIIELVKRREGLRCAFLEKLGVSTEKPPLTQAGRTAEGSYILGGYQPPSPAEDLVSTISMMNHVPIYDLKLLQNAETLITILKARIKSLNSPAELKERFLQEQQRSANEPQTREARRPEQHNPEKPKKRIENKARPAELEQPSTTNEMTEKAFMDTYLDHPDVVVALGHGTHVDKVAKKFGVTITR